MIRKYGYIVLAVALLVVLSLSPSLILNLRSGCVGAISPSWRHLSNLKDLFLKFTTILPSGGYHTPPHIAKELEMIRLENHQLHAQVDVLKSELTLEAAVQTLAKRLESNTDMDAYSSIRRKKELFRQLELYAHAITARVIFRESGAWKSSFWVNVGESTNRRLATRLVEKNSPVVLGETVIGVIDYVGKERSRVRLVTDRAIVSSIRVIRSCGAQEKPLYLAKGAVQGASSALWRSSGTVLRGIGFNYDFEDEEGPARSLLQQDPLLIQEGDIAITTGMDGIFPPGLRVGRVVKAYPLKEGASSYEADIQSFVERFDDLNFVTILPAVGGGN